MRRSEVGFVFPPPDDVEYTADGKFFFEGDEAEEDSEGEEKDNKKGTTRKPKRTSSGKGRRSNKSSGGKKEKGKTREEDAGEKKEKKSSKKEEKEDDETQSDEPRTVGTTAAADGSYPGGKRGPRLQDKLLQFAERLIERAEVQSTDDLTACFEEALPKFEAKFKKKDCSVNHNVCI